MKTRDIENRNRGRDRQSGNDEKSERMNPGTRKRGSMSNSFEEARRDKEVSGYHSGSTRMNDRMQNEGGISGRDRVRGEMSSSRAMSPDRSSDWEATNKYGHERRENPMRNDDNSGRKERFEPGWGNRDYDQDQRSVNIQNSSRDVDGGSNRTYPSMSSGYENKDSGNWETSRESDERRKKGEERKSRRTSDRGRTESDRYEEW